MKKQVQKSVQKIPSPENYIKTKARTLPLGKCYINRGWKEAGMGSIFVTRKHITGNLTYGSYLVDLYALGTKNTMYDFNKTQKSFDAIINDPRADYEEIEYNLAHNIIYGANKYAVANGFKIHKDFEKLTEYILEVNVESIPFIDIEFGKDGKPLVIDFSSNF